MKIGTNESKIPAIELLTFCCAKGNKNIGMKFPKHPPMTTHFINLLGMYLKFRMPKNAKTKPAIDNLNAPTCIGVKAEIPCLIKMNELPQVRERIAKIAHLFDKNFMEQM